MTEEEAEAIGKRLVACRHFRPLRGMLDMQGRSWDQSLLWRWNNDCDVPDLRDPATLGCVLALVRAAYPAPTIEFEGAVYEAHCYPENGSGFWYMRRDCGDGDEELFDDGTWGWRNDNAEPVHADTEAEVLVAALEAAP